MNKDPDKYKITTYIVVPWDEGDVWLDKDGFPVVVDSMPLAQLPLQFKYLMSMFKKLYKEQK